MRIRHYTPADLDAVKQLHATQGFGYPFPDLESPLFVTKLILEEDEGDARGEIIQDKIIENKGREEASASFLPDVERRDPSSKTATGRAQPARIVMAAFLRLTAEAYLLHDASAGTPRQRWQNLLALHEAARRDATTRGLDDVQAFLPPRVARAFGRRLARLGWRQDPWPCFTRVVGDS